MRGQRAARRGCGHRRKPGGPKRRKSAQSGSWAVERVRRAVRTEGKAGGRGAGGRKQGQISEQNVKSKSQGWEALSSDAGEIGGGGVADGPVGANVVRNPGPQKGLGQAGPFHRLQDAGVLDRETGRATLRTSPGAFAGGQDNQRRKRGQGLPVRTSPPAQMSPERPRFSTSKRRGRSGAPCHFRLSLICW